MSHETDERDDATLTQLTASGDGAAFAALVRRHSAALLRYLGSLGAQSAQADDAAQDALVDFWTHASSVTSSSVRAWLFTAGRRRLLRANRHAAVHPLDDARACELADHADLAVLARAAGFGAESLPEAQLSDAESLHRLHRAIDRLSPHYREVIVLVDLESLSYDAAAAITNLSVPSVRSRLHRARLALAASVREEVLS
jgi:RNA polymerase sigma-70 factor (ECF subfamily)